MLKATPTSTFHRSRPATTTHPLGTCPSALCVQKETHMKRKRSFYRYTLRVGKKTKSVGITNSPKRRLAEHLRNGKARCT